MKKILMLLFLIGVISAMSVSAAWTLRGMGDNMYMYDMEEGHKVINTHCIGEGYKNFYYTKTEVCHKDTKPLNYYYSKTKVCDRDRKPLNYYHSKTDFCCNSWIVR